MITPTKVVTRQNLDHVRPQGDSARLELRAKPGRKMLNRHVEPQVTNISRVGKVQRMEMDIRGTKEAVKDDRKGTKAAPYYVLQVPAEGNSQVMLCERGIVAPRGADP